MKKDITILIAHPDDEALFLWPFLEHANRIIAVVSDRDNAARRWCNKRAEALAEVCDLIGCQVHNLEMNSGFYRAPREGLQAICDKIGMALESTTGPIATHNAWGEYGHLDHIVCHNVAASFKGRLRLTTDITMQRDWLPMCQDREMPPREVDVIEYELDLERFQKIEAIYRKHGCWTWDGGVKEVCNAISF